MGTMARPPIGCSLLALLACSGEPELAVSQAPPAQDDSPPALLLGVLDQDGSGTLDAAEFDQVAHPSRELAHFDTDGSGELDVPELRQMLLGLSPLLEDYRGSGTYEGRPVHMRPGAPGQPPPPPPPPND